MSPTANNSSKIADWLKWGVGLTWAAMSALVVYVVSVEHRLTTTETTQANHIASAAKSETAIYTRLDRQDDNITKVLSGIGQVQIDVATIKGYMERKKNDRD